MESRISRALLRILTSLALVSLGAIAVAAQGDSDPNSPTPVLLSEADSTYALLLAGKSRGRVDISRLPSRPIPMYSTIKLFVTNISLMKDEGANAFRINVEDQAGRTYRFPVLEIELYDGIKSDTPVYAVTVQVKDDLGYWDTPPADGDVLVGLTWRGLVSNRVKVSINVRGGKIKEDPGAVPTPPGSKAAAKTGVTVQGKTPPSPDYVGYRFAGDRMRFLEQATFGPTAALDARIRRIGLNTWLSEQFSAPYPSITNPYPNQPLQPGNAPANCDGDQIITPDVPVTCFRDT